MITFQDVKENPAIQTYIQKADESLTALGYTCLLYTSGPAVYEWVIPALYQQQL